MRLWLWSVNSDTGIIYINYLELVITFLEATRNKDRESAMFFFVFFLTETLCALSILVAPMSAVVLLRWAELRFGDAVF